MMESGGVEGSGEGTPGRILLPKSISIQSTGYLKPVQPGGNGGGKVNKVQNRSKIWDDTVNFAVWFTDFIPAFLYSAML